MVPKEPPPVLNQQSPPSQISSRPQAPIPQMPPIPQRNQQLPPIPARNKPPPLPARANQQ